MEVVERLRNWGKPPSTNTPEIYEMKKKIEAILQKTSKSSREERKKKQKEQKRKETPAAKLGKGRLTDTGKKVTLVELTGGEKKLTHDEFCKIVYKSTFSYREGENRCRVGIVDGSNIKIYVLTGDEMDSIYSSVVTPEKEGKK